MEFRRRGIQGGPLTDTRHWAPGLIAVPDVGLLRDAPQGPSPLQLRVSQRHELLPSVRERLRKSSFLSPPGGPRRRRLRMEGNDMKSQSRPKKVRRAPPAAPANKGQHPQGWVPIQAPTNLEEMFQHWVESEEPNVGWCLMCDSPIRSEADMIPGTNSHNCEAGRQLDERIRAAEAADQSHKAPRPPASKRVSIETVSSLPDTGASGWDEL